MSHRPRLALASLALAASLAAATLPAQAAPRGFGPDLMDHLSGLLERAWAALFGAEAQHPFEKDGPCPDPNGKPMPNCPAAPGPAGERTAGSPFPEPNA